ncbi:MAG: hypothetical protein KH372_08945 [Olsenella uli]|uniref:hypothetical protein n=1 Tax=Olsenella uli TaxID=133926 RepID=UPI001D75BA85|nr:hypothetical protein [Olsenella uli]MBS6418930.1 hypothetical protein [Olsenella uli]
MSIVYHDDNTGRIPHAQVVVNNTNVVTGRRLQDPDPKELKLPPCSAWRTNGAAKAPSYACLA